MGLSYKDTGVDIDHANALIDRVKSHIKTTHRPHVLSSIGGFAALSTLGGTYDDPVLVSGTDGVGTKLLVAKALGTHNTIGIDLVAMCVNDIVTTGATPLFFLDYLGCGNIGTIDYEEIIAGIVEGCKRGNLALVGGETAELPSMYPEGEYDLAGFAVGVVERKKIIDGASVKEGDAILGVPSTGAHSNGFSLVRKIIEHNHLDYTNTYGLGAPLGDVLLAPTALYANLVQALAKEDLIAACAHITGGGLIENAIRVIPKNVDLRFERAALPRLPIFEFLQKEGEVEEAEMYRVFNMGIGMTLIVAQECVERALVITKEEGYPAAVIGTVVNGEGKGRIE